MAVASIARATVVASIGRYFVNDPTMANDNAGGNRLRNALLQSGLVTWPEDQ